MHTMPLGRRRADAALLLQPTGTPSGILSVTTFTRELVNDVLFHLEQVFHGQVAGR